MGRSIRPFHHLMKKRTRDGIYYDLRESPFQFRSGSVIFYFSSSLNLQRFNERLPKRQSTVNGYLSKLFGFEIEAGHITEIHLYTKIEMRGFLMSRETSRGLEFICQINDLRLNGGTPTKKN